MPIDSGGGAAVSRWLSGDARLGHGCPEGVLSWKVATAADVLELSCVL